MSNEAIKVSGPITFISDPQVISDKLTKQTIVITMGDKYPEPIAVEAANDKLDMLHGLKVGDEIVAYANLRGREWNGRYFVNLSLWKIEAAGTTSQAAPAAATLPRQNANPSLRQQPGAQIADPSDEMPF